MRLSCMRSLSQSCSKCPEKRLVCDVSLWERELLLNFETVKEYEYQNYVFPFPSSFYSCLSAEQLRVGRLNSLIGNVSVTLSWVLDMNGMTPWDSVSRVSEWAQESLQIPHLPFLGVGGWTAASFTVRMIFLEDYTKWMASEEKLKKMLQVLWQPACLCQFDNIYSVLANNTEAALVLVTRNLTPK